MNIKNLLHFSEYVSLVILAKLILIFVAASLLFTSISHGIVIQNPLFGIEPINNADQLDVNRAVARVCDGDGSNTAGSATYIRGKYLLTANQVENRSHVTFDGFTFYERDTAFEPQQIVAEGQNIDLKVIKLLETPDFSGAGIEITMYADKNSNADIVQGIDDALIVGWGVGNGTSRFAHFSSSSIIWTWGDNSTIDKRRGYNAVNEAQTFSGEGYNYEALVTDLSPFFFEGGIARFDEGAGMFTVIDGEWQLIGIATHYTQTAGDNTSTFGFSFDSYPPDLNYFVRISTYIDEIEAVLADPPPDPSTYSGWKLTQGLEGADALDTADTDGDGIVQLLEFALGGNPNQSDIEIYPTSQLVTESEKTYLQITLTRPQGLANTTYSAEVSLDLSNWADPSEFVPAIPLTVTDPVVVDEGIEAVVYRVEVTNDEKLFIRLRVSVTS